MSPSMKRKINNLLIQHSSYDNIALQHHHKSFSQLSSSYFSTSLSPLQNTVTREINNNFHTSSSSLDKPFFYYELIHQSKKPNSLARVGRIHTPNGIIDTPSYVPVATNAALKGVDFRTLDDYCYDNVMIQINENMMNMCNNDANYNAKNDDNGNDENDYSNISKQLVFCNTYHLLLHPGREVIRDAGGLHKFTARLKNRNNDRLERLSGGGPFITDSGGFQVFSLMYGSIESERRQQEQYDDQSNNYMHHQEQEQEQQLKRKHNHKPHWNLNVIGPKAVTVTEEGVTFQSYRDESTILLTPENTIHAQKDFGADIIIPLDELPPHHISRQTLVESVRRSHRWEKRSLDVHLQNLKKQAMYGVIHGGLDTKMRVESLDYISSLPFDGFAIGGSLGKNRQDLKKLLSWFMPLFENKDEKQRLKPRHLLGIADEESIRNAVALGIDTMDSCYPTRLGRHGTLLTSDGYLRIKRGQHARSFGMPIEEGCLCRTCQRYDRAYVNHLFKCNDPLAMTLGTQHNLFYMQKLMAGIRQDILNDKL